MRTAALFATVAVLLTLLVSHCAGRPWQQQPRQRQQRQRPLRPAAAAAAVAIAYELSTAAATSYAQYDDPPSQVVDDPSPPFRQEPSEPDYGDPERLFVEPERVYAEPEQNYEVDEAVSVLSNGRVHGVQNHHHQSPTTTVPLISSSSSSSSTTTTTTTGDDINGIGTTTTIADSTVCSTTAASSTITITSAAAGNSAETRKSGYVVDGKHYRKYRVEEETPDGFIVGEYGVVSHHDGTTRGVRYTADSSINPRVIYEALAKFLNLKRRR